MDAIFPEARLSLKDADPEIHGLLRSEMNRQWCVRAKPGCDALVSVPDALAYFVPMHR
jgi:hypothetical protein